MSQNTSQSAIPLATYVEFFRNVDTIGQSLIAKVRQMQIAGDPNAASLISSMETHLADNPCKDIPVNESQGDPYALPYSVNKDTICLVASSTGEYLGVAPDSPIANILNDLIEVRKLFRKWFLIPISTNNSVGIDCSCRYMVIDPSVDSMVYGWDSATGQASLTGQEKFLDLSSPSGTWESRSTLIYKNYLFYKLADDSCNICNKTNIKDSLTSEYNNWTNVEAGHDAINYIQNGFTNSYASPSGCMCNQLLQGWTTSDNGIVVTAIVTKVCAQDILLTIKPEQQDADFIGKTSLFALEDVIKYVHNYWIPFMQTIGYATHISPTCEFNGEECVPGDPVETQALEPDQGRHNTYSWVFDNTLARVKMFKDTSTIDDYYSTYQTSSTFTVMGSYYNIKSCKGQIMYDCEPDEFYDTPVEYKSYWKAEKIQLWYLHPILAIVRSLYGSVNTEGERVIYQCCTGPLFIGYRDALINFLTIIDTKLMPTYVPTPPTGQWDERFPAQIESIRYDPQIWSTFTYPSDCYWYIGYGTGPSVGGFEEACVYGIYEVSHTNEYTQLSEDAVVYDCNKIVWPPESSPAYTKEGYYDCALNKS